MTAEIAAIITAVLALIGTLVGTYAANRKSAALVEYRLEQLEKKVDLHNSVIERTYKLEEQVALLESEDKRQNERLKTLEATKNDKK